MIRLPIGLAALCLSASVLAAPPFDDKFRQLDELLPTPGAVRNASGAPGHAYWQQRADYTMRATLDENKRAISGSGTITYHNNSPDTLKYLWLQLDENIYKPDSAARATATLPSREAWQARGADGVKFDSLRTLLTARDFEGGFNVRNVRDSGGRALKYTINGTMMRIDLPQSLKPGAKVSFSLDWNYNINEQKVLGGRSGYEKFDDKNDLFEIALWFPRMAAYYDVYGWQHKQFLGSGEFTLEFGDYDVQITVPSDHIVASTGELQNPGDVLTAAQRERLRQARTAKKPVLIVTQAEAEAAEMAAPPPTRPGTSRPRTCATSPGPPAASSSGTRRASSRATTTCWPCPTTRKKATRCGSATRLTRSSTPSSSTASTPSTTPTRPRFP
jgi:hypothetical protein